MSGFVSGNDVCACPVSALREVVPGEWQVHVLCPYSGNDIVCLCPLKDRVVLEGMTCECFVSV